jgi:hypothetical protein
VQRCKAAKKRGFEKLRRVTRELEEVVKGPDFKKF